MMGVITCYFMAIFFIYISFRVLINIVTWQSHFLQLILLKSDCFAMTHTAWDCFVVRQEVRQTSRNDKNQSRLWSFFGAITINFPRNFRNQYLLHAQPRLWRVAPKPAATILIIMECPALAGYYKISMTAFPL